MKSRQWQRYALLGTPWLILCLLPWLALWASLGPHGQGLAHKIPVGVVDLDQSASTRAMVRQIQTWPQSQVEQCSSVEVCQQQLRQGALEAVLVLPRGTAEALREGRTVRPVLLRMASNQVASAQIQGAASQWIAQTQTALRAARLVSLGMDPQTAAAKAAPIRLETHLLGNPQMDYRKYLGTALPAVFLSLTWALAGAALRPKAWHQHKFFAAFWGLYIVLSGLYIAQIYLPSLGHAQAQPLLLGSAWIALAGLSMGIGLALRRHTGSASTAAQWTLALQTPAFMLSGIAFPAEAMPKFWANLGAWHPYGAYIRLQEASLGGWEAPPTALYSILLWTVVLSVLLWIKPKVKSAQSRPTTEIQWINRHPVVRPLFWIAPLLYLAFYGGTYAHKQNLEMPVAWVSNSSTTTVWQRQFLRHLDAHPRLSPVPMSLDQAQAALARGQIMALVNLPQDADLDWSKGRPIRLNLQVRSERFLIAGDMQRAVSEVISAHNLNALEDVWQSKGLSPARAKMRAETLILDDRPMGNPAENYGDFMLPMVGLLVLHQLLVLGLAFLSSQGEAKLLSLLKRGALWIPWFGSWAVLWCTTGLQYFESPHQIQGGTLVELVLVGMTATAGMGIACGLALRHGSLSLRILAFSAYPLYFSSGYGWPQSAMPELWSRLGETMALGPMLRGVRLALSGSSASDLGALWLHLGLLTLIWWSVAGLLALVQPQRVAN